MASGFVVAAAWLFHQVVAAGLAVAAEFEIESAVIDLLGIDAHDSDEFGGVAGLSVRPHERAAYEPSCSCGQATGGFFALFELGQLLAYCDNYTPSIFGRLKNLLKNGIICSIIE